MQFNLEQLRAFSLSVETGSFSAAARKMGKAQSAVSTAISNLELDLGVTLFDRSRREPVLTEEGQVLLPQARLILQQAQLLSGHADALVAGEEGRISLAVEESLLGEELEQLIVRMDREFPLLELELLVPARRDILQLIQQGRADIGVLLSTMETWEGYYLKPLKQMSVIAVAATDHPLAGELLPDLDALKQHRQLVLTSRAGGLSPGDGEQMGSRIWKVESLYVLLDLVRQGLGWAWVPEHIARKWLQEDKLCMLHFDGGGDMIHMPLDLVISPTYKEGQVGRWLHRELLQLSFLV